MQPIQPDAASHLDKFERRIYRGASSVRITCGERTSMADHADIVASSEPDPVIRAYLAEVDRTLIRKNLRLTPEARLRQLMALQHFAEEIARAGREARRRDRLP